MTLVVDLQTTQNCLVLGSWVAISGLRHSFPLLLLSNVLEPSIKAKTVTLS